MAKAVGDNALLLATAATVAVGQGQRNVPLDAQVADQVEGLKDEVDILRGNRLRVYVSTLFHSHQALPLPLR